MKAEWAFGDRYVFRVVEALEEPASTDLMASILGGRPPIASLPWASGNPEKARALKEGFKAPESLRIAVYAGAELIGFTFGAQIHGDCFHMNVSLVVPEHRRNGIYGELLRATLEFTREAGFQRVTSCHKATNNPVLIAKLKAGFVISGMELSDHMGTLVHLTYFHHPERARLMEMRSGMIRPEGAQRDLFF